MTPETGGDEERGYRPAEYWSRRLERDFSLKGTGHLDYSEGYNAWLYRAKGRALGRALGRAGEARSALDVGSGVGWVVEQLLGRGLEVEGCDIAPVAVRRLRERYPRATFFELALGEDPIPRPDASYDVVTALDVAYHVVDEDKWRSGLAEIARVLRPGGALIVIDGLGDRDRAPADHVRFRSLATWAGAGEGLGLDVEAVLPCYRWLSRGRGRGALGRLPDRARGATEYALELLAPRAPHMRCAVLRRR